jgi:transcriptional regulator with XRE-family HTH domain
MPPAKRHTSPSPESGKSDASPVNRTRQARGAKKDERFAGRLHLALDGRSQIWLAEATGLSRSTINDYVKGAIPSADRAFMIADALGVSAEWLVTGRDASLRRLETGQDDVLLARVSHSDLMRGMDAPLRTRIRMVGPALEYAFLDYGKDYRFLFLTTMPAGGPPEVAAEGELVIGARAAELLPGTHYFVRVTDRLEVRLLSEDGRQLLRADGNDPLPTPPLEHQGPPPFIVAMVVGAPTRVLSP